MASDSEFTDFAVASNGTTEQFEDFGSFESSPSNTTSQANVDINSKFDIQPTAFQTTNTTTSQESQIELQKPPIDDFGDFTESNGQFDDFGDFTSFQSNGKLEIGSNVEATLAEPTPIHSSHELNPSTPSTEDVALQQPIKEEETETTIEDSITNDSITTDPKSPTKSHKEEETQQLPPFDSQTIQHLEKQLSNNEEPTPTVSIPEINETMSSAELESSNPSDKSATPPNEEMEAFQPLEMNSSQVDTGNENNTIESPRFDFEETKTTDEFKSEPIFITPKKDFDFEEVGTETLSQENPKEMSEDNSESLQFEDSTSPRSPDIKTTMQFDEFTEPSTSEIEPSPPSNQESIHFSEFEEPSSTKELPVKSAERLQSSEISGSQDFNDIPESTSTNETTSPTMQPPQRKDFDFETFEFDDTSISKPTKTDSTEATTTFQPEFEETRSSSLSTDELHQNDKTEAPITSRSDLDFGDFDDFKEAPKTTQTTTPSPTTTSTAISSSQPQLPDEDFADFGDFEAPPSTTAVPTTSNSKSDDFGDFTESAQDADFGDFTESQDDFGFDAEFEEPPKQPTTQPVQNVQPAVTKKPFLEYPPEQIQTVISNLLTGAFGSLPAPPPDAKSSDGSSLYGLLEPQLFDKIREHSQRERLPTNISAIQSKFFDVLNVKSIQAPEEVVQEDFEDPSVLKPQMNRSSVAETISSQKPTLQQSTPVANIQPPPQSAPLRKSADKIPETAKAVPANRASETPTPPSPSGFRKFWNTAFGLGASTKEAQPPVKQMAPSKSSGSLPNLLRSSSGSVPNVNTQLNAPNNASKSVSTTSAPASNDPFDLAFFSTSANKQPNKANANSISDTLKDLGFESPEISKKMEQPKEDLLASLMKKSTPTTELFVNSPSTPPIDDSEESKVQRILSKIPDLSFMFAPRNLSEQISRTSSASQMQQFKADFNSDHFASLPPKPQLPLHQMKSGTSDLSFLRNSAESSSTNTPKTSNYAPPAEHYRLLGWSENISRDQAAKKLENAAPRSFLVRWSDNAKCYVLSYKTRQNRIEHVAGVKPISNGKFVLNREDGSTLHYSSVLEFITALKGQGTIAEPIKV